MTTAINVSQPKISTAESSPYDEGFIAYVFPSGSTPTKHISWKTASRLIELQRNVVDIEGTRLVIERNRLNVISGLEDDFKSFASSAEDWASLTSEAAFQSWPTK